MTVKKMAESAGLTFVTGEQLSDREVSGVYACDLLSWVIGRAQENSAFVTVMTNVNVIAVAIMADLSCVILSEGVKLDDNALEKAIENDMIVLSSDKTTFGVCADLSSLFN